MISLRIGTSLVVLWADINGLEVGSALRHSRNAKGEGATALNDYATELAFDNGLTVKIISSL